MSTDLLSNLPHAGSVVNSVNSLHFISAFVPQLELKNGLLKSKYTGGYSLPLNAASCGKQQRTESKVI